MKGSLRFGGAIYASCQRFSAAFFAIADLCSADSFALRAFALAFPDLTFLEGRGDSSISPVAIFAVRTARAFTSAGRFSPLGPVDTNGGLHQLIG